MTTEWAVSIGVQRLELTPSGTAEAPGPSTGLLQFTVTNPGPVEDRAVLEIVAGDGARREWFAVAEPLQPVPAGRSVTFLVTVTVPAGTPAGPFWIQGRVYSADTAPEEGSELSNRITGEVAASTVKRPKRWWLLAAAGLIVIVLGVVGWLVLRPTEPPPPPQQVSLPLLTGLAQDQAEQQLTGLGLQVGAIKHRHVVGAGREVVGQSVAAGELVDVGTVVELEVALEVPAPVLISPGNGATVPAGSQPELRWQEVPEAGSYRVLRTYRQCVRRRRCEELLLSDTVVATNFWQPEPGPLPDFATGLVHWWVVSIDDFGTLTNPSDNFAYQVGGQ